MTKLDIGDLAIVGQDCESCGSSTTLELDHNHYATLVCDKCGSYFYTDEYGEVVFNEVNGGGL